ncbi:MAG: Rap1a/Tai family immunity protein [Gammaproteobacteria bacterium]
MAWSVVHGVSLMAISAAAAAAPSAGELATTCRAAQAAAYRGPDAAACTWYLDPCEACSVDAAPPRWCAPTAVDDGARVRLLLEHLAAAPHDAARPAPIVVAELLAGHFPCAPEAAR